MIDTPHLYLLSLAVIALFFGMAERQTHWKLFEYLPSVVLIYATSMLLANAGLWERNEAVSNVYSTLKSNLLAAMLFLILLQLDLKAFFSLGRKMLIAYVSAVVSIALSFVAVFMLFGFEREEAGMFAALCGSWMGGTANMLAVANAFEVGEHMMGYALIVDAVDYAFWVMLLLGLVKLSGAFNRWSGSACTTESIEQFGCSCTIGPKRYWSLFGLSLAVALLCGWLSVQFGGLGGGTWLVIFATLFGLLGSFTRLKELNGSGELSTTMLYLLVALIGSRASFEGFEEVPLYLATGLCILTLHAVVMLLSAKIFKLDLFSIGVASLANIGGVASAPILAAAYHRSLVGIAVLMAVMGYLIGTVVALGVGYALLRVAG